MDTLALGTNAAHSLRVTTGIIGGNHGLEDTAHRRNFRLHGDQLLCLRRAVTRWPGIQR
jgi:hypothetical protein